MPHHRLVTRSWLWVLPALVDRLQAIPVGIQDIGRIVTSVVVKPCSRLSVVAGTRRHGCPVEGMDLRLTAGHESNMNCLRFRAPLAQPEKHTLVASETLKVRMAFRTILAIVIDRMLNPERGQGLFVKCDRAFEVGYC